MSDPPASPSVVHPASSTEDETPPQSPAMPCTVREEPDGTPGQPLIDTEVDSDEDESVVEDTSETETLDTETRDSSSFGGAETEFTSNHCLVRLGKKIDRWSDSVVWIRV
jgi:hypothetical protein